MTHEEYKARLAALEKEFRVKRIEVARDYAMSNNPYKVGDILQNDSCILRVERVLWGYKYSGEPECY